MSTPEGALALLTREEILEWKATVDKTVARLRELGDTDPMVVARDLPTRVLELFDRCDAHEDEAGTISDCLFLTGHLKEWKHEPGTNSRIVSDVLREYAELKKLNDVLRVALRRYHPETDGEGCETCKLLTATEVPEGYTLAVQRATLERAVEATCSLCRDHVPFREGNAPDRLPWQHFQQTTVEEDGTPRGLANDCRSMTLRLLLRDLK